ncbi:unnamed protein product [Linum trigynum]|uniref:Uncharacterized protein n=1 Tax=Linum trigynum TaxID=586398 RepID=A0AAV2DVF1_9ROSI
MVWWLLKQTTDLGDRNLSIGDVVRNATSEKISIGDRALPNDDKKPPIGGGQHFDIQHRRSFEVSRNPKMIFGIGIGGGAEGLKQMVASKGFGLGAAQLLDFC